MGFLKIQWYKNHDIFYKITSDTRFKEEVWKAPKEK